MSIRAIVNELSPVAPAAPFTTLCVGAETRNIGLRRPTRWAWALGTLLLAMGLAPEALAFKVGVHEKITEVALQNAGSPPFDRFTIDLIAGANGATDLHEPEVDAAHADNNHLFDASQRLTEKRNAINTALSTCGISTATVNFGQALHTVQDIYSHSNAIDNGHTIGDLLNIQVGRPGCTSSECTPARCETNNNFAPGGLVTGYFSLDGFLYHFGDQCRDMPDGMCCHRDLSKDKDLQPDVHNDRHDVAREAAENATLTYLAQVENYIRANHSSAEANYMINRFRTRQRSQGFVIDDSGSMSDNIGTVQDLVLQYIDELQLNGESPSLGLVTFANTTRVRPPFCSGLEAFLTAINAIHADNGGEPNGECPESMNTALLDAMYQFPGFTDNSGGHDSARTGGRIFLATDAAALDYQQGRLVAYRAAQNGISIDVALMGDCGQGEGDSGPSARPSKRTTAANTNASGAPAPSPSVLDAPYVRPYLRELTARTGGVLLEIEPGEFADVAPLLLRLNDPALALVMLRRYAAGVALPSALDVPIDDSFSSSVTFLVSSTKQDDLAQVALRRPDGVLVATSDAGITHTRLSTLDRYTIATPMPGIWRLEFFGGFGNTVRVFGNSTLLLEGVNFLSDDLSGKIVRPEVDLIPIQGVPAANTEVVGRAILTGPVQQARMVLRQADGDLLREVASVLEDQRKLEGRVRIPNESYTFEVAGSTVTGHVFQRQIAATVLAPSLAISTRRSLYYAAPGSTGRIRVSVTNTATTATTVGVYATSDSDWAKPATDAAMFTLAPGATHEVDVEIPLLSSAPIGASSRIELVAFEEANEDHRNSTSISLVAESGHNHVPTAVTAELSVDEDYFVEFNLAALDVDDDVFTFEIVAQPVHGHLFGTPPHLGYAPGPDFNGSDRLSFRANDGTANSEPAAINFVVRPINDAPVASTINAQMPQAAEIAIQLSGIDTDGDALSYMISVPPQHGVIIGQPPSIIYRPDGAFVGTDQFMYQVRDGALSSVNAAVTIEVTAISNPNDAPVAHPQTVNTHQGQAVAIALIGSDPDGDALHFSVASQPAHGTLTGTAPALTYTPAANFRGTDTFNFFVRDAQLSSPTAAVTIVVAAINVAPLAQNMSVETDVDTSISILLAANDADGDALNFAVLTSPQHGTLNGVAPALIYAPAAGYVGADSFSFRASDGNANSNTATVSIVVRSVSARAVAFSVFTPEHQLAIWDNNIASSREGSSVVSVSSGQGELAIDDLPTTFWTTNTGAVSDQSLILRLGDSGARRFDRVRLVNRSTSASIKNFAVAVSTTTNTPDAYTTVIDATALNNSAVQEFRLPQSASANFVRLLVRDNYGGSTDSLAAFELIDSGRAGIATYAGDEPSVSSFIDVDERPENLLDGKTGTRWTTTQGAAAPQFVIVRLEEETLIDRVRLQGRVFQDATVRDFQVQVAAASGVFAPVLNARLENNGAMQEFRFPAGPVRADRVKLVVVSTQTPGAAAVELTAFEVPSMPSEGHVVSFAEAQGPALDETPSLLRNGAFVVDYSSAASSNGPNNLLDGVTNTAWRTVGLIDQYVVFQLAGGRSTAVEGVRLLPGNQAAAVRDFEIWVSDSAGGSQDFHRVLQATLPQTGNEQVFTFPGGAVSARYVRFVPLSNYGDANAFSTVELEVRIADMGGVVGYSSRANPQQRAESAIDGDSATSWATQSGAATNQWLKLRLAGGALRRIASVTIQPDASIGPKQFQLRVSTTTDSDAAFTTVLSGTVANSSTLQTFALSPAIDARYVQFFWVNGYNLSTISVKELGVVFDGESGGTRLLAVSSQRNDTNTPLKTLSQGSANSFWETALDQVGEQSFKIALVGNDGLLIDQVLLRSPVSAGEGVRDFELQLSLDSPDDAAFHSVLRGTLRDIDQLQHFRFAPTRAHYARFVARNNYGARTIRLGRFWLVSPERGGYQVRFNDRSAPVDVTNRVYLWNFGDSGTSPERDPEHAYATAGIYDVRLAISQAGNSVGESNGRYQVLGAPVTAYRYAPQIIHEGETVRFTDLSEFPSGAAQFREWSWGDGSPATLDEPVTDHSFGDNGRYEVRLRVGGAQGQVGIARRVIEVLNLPPVADAGSDLTLRPGQAWTERLVASATDAVTADRNTLQCRWKFGDGSADSVGPCSTFVRAPHTFVEGHYVATLTVTDKDGASSSDSINVDVRRGTSTLVACGPRQGITGTQLDTEVWAMLKLEDAVSAQGFAIQLTTGGQVRTLIADASGLVRLPITVAAGTASSVLASFAGDAMNAPVSGTSSIEVPRVSNTVNLAGTEHWTAFSKNEEVGHTAVLYVTSAVPTRGRWSSPEVGFCQDYEVIPGQTTRISRPQTNFDFVLYNSDRVDRKSVHLMSLDETVVYALNHTDITSDATLVYPQDALGSDYFVEGYVGQNGRSDLNVELVVIGVANGTLVTIVPTAEAFEFITPRPIGVPYTITLNRGEVYQVMGRRGDYSGTRVTSNKPVAVIIAVPHADVPVESTGIGFLVEQMPPIDSWGRRFVTIPLALRGTGSNRVRVMASRNGTEVRVNGIVVAQLAAGQLHERASDQSALIEANNPVLVMQYSNNQGFDNTTIGGPFMIVVPPAEQFNNSYTLSAMPENFLRHFINVVVPVSASASLRVDDAAIAPQLLVPIAGSNYVGAQLEVTPGAHRLVADLPFSVSAYGYGTRNAYGYSGAMNNAPIGRITELALTPSQESVAINQQACVVAKAGDAAHHAIIGARVDFVVTGVHARNGFVVTDELGQARYCYNGDTVGDDTVTAQLVAFSATATKHWLAANHAPVALDGTLSTQENRAVSFTLAATDADGNALSYTVVQAPLHGSLSGVAPQLTYTPQTGFDGQDSLRFTASDATATSNIAMVSIMVAAVNVAPIAANQTLPPLTGSTAPITLSATDADGDALTYAVVTQPAHGALSGAVPQLIYTANAGYDGSDSFIFKANDGREDSNLATITLAMPASVSVLDAEVAEGQSGTSVVTVRLQLSSPAQTAASVSWRTRDATAFSASDYTSASGIATIAVGAQGAELPITILGDAFLEGNESFLLEITSVSGVRVGRAVATITIRDDETCESPNLIANPGAELAMINGEIPAWSEVRGNQWRRWDPPPAPFEGQVTFDAGEAAADGWAELIQDVDLSAYARFIDAGHQVFVFSGALRTLAETPSDAAQIVVEYLNATGVVLSRYDSGALSSPLQWLEVSDQRSVPAATRRARVHLLANQRSSTDLDAWFDALSLRSVGVPTVSVGDVVVDESAQNATFAISLSCPLTHDLTLGYATANGTAIAGSDYVAQSGNTTIAAGASTRQILIAMQSDTKHEETEAFTLTLSMANTVQDVVLADASASATVLDDDAAAQCVAGPLGIANTFNVFVTDSIVQINSDVEGRLAAGTNADLTNYSVGFSLPGPSGDVLVAGGNLKFVNGTVHHGNVAYGGNANLTGLSVPNGTTRKATPINFVAEATALKAKSSYFAGLPANGTTEIPASKAITLRGQDASLNVFSVPGADLALATQLAISVPATSSVVVNVSGQSDTLQFFGFQLNGLDRRKVLYNFSQATQLRVQGIGIEGTVLAPKAAVQFDNGQINGSLIAKSLTGNGQSNLSLYQGCLPVP